MKSKIIIFKKKNTKQSADTGDFYLKTEACNNREVCHTENHNKDILITETQDKTITQGTYSIKKINTLNIKNLNINPNYLSTETTKNVISSTKRKESSINEMLSPVNQNINSKLTAQKQSSFKAYINQVRYYLKQNLYPLSVQNGTKMFTKIKINPNIQVLLKDFKRKLNTHSDNKDREYTNNLNNIMQTEVNDVSKKQGRKIINFKTNMKNHSISNSNKLSDYSHILQKPDTSLSKEKKLMESPVVNILQTETNTNSTKKINSFNKSNVYNASDRIATLSALYSKNKVDNRASSPKLQKIITSEKTNQYNCRIVNPRINISNRDNNDILYNKQEAFFNIEDIKNIKDKIFSFCKRNLFDINEVTFFFTFD